MVCRMVKTWKLLIFIMYFLFLYTVYTGWLQAWFPILKQFVNVVNSFKIKYPLRFLYCLFFFMYTAYTGYALSLFESQSNHFQLFNQMPPHKVNVLLIFKYCVSFFVYTLYTAYTGLAPSLFSRPDQFFYQLHPFSYTRCTQGRLKLDFQFWKYLSI